MQRGGGTASRTRPTSQTFVAGAASPIDLADRARRRPLLRRLRRIGAPHPLLRRRPTARPTAMATADPAGRRRAADRELRRHGLHRSRRRQRSPTRGTSTATAPSTTRPRRAASWTYTSRGEHVVSSASHRRCRRLRHRLGDDRRRPAGRDDQHARSPALDLGGRRHDLVLGLGYGQRRPADPSPRLCRGRSYCTTDSARRAISTRFRPSTALPAARSWRRTTSTHPRSSWC